MDVGGSNARVALVQGTRLLAERHSTTGHQRTPDDVCADLVTAVQELTSSPMGRNVRAVGLGVAGQVDPATGVVRAAPNLGWHDFPLRESLSDALDLRVHVLNDVQAAAYGEWRYGAARGATDAVAIFVGTGVGGGIISGGDLVRGCDGTAGELGHTIIEQNGVPCRCGRRGCLEAYIGGWAIARRAREAVFADPTGGHTLLDRAGGMPEGITGSLVAAAAAAGDPLAQEMVREIGTALGVGMASIINAFNPCVLVLGGGVIEGMPELVPIAEATARERALAAAVRSLAVRPAALHGSAGTIGAAEWARRRQT